jgi:hypothetical protein
MLGFSHLINELDFQRIYLGKYTGDQIGSNYLGNILKTHKGWVIQASHITNSKGKKEGQYTTFVSPQDFLALFDDESTLAGLIENITDLFQSTEKLNQTKRTNLLAAMDALYVLKSNTPTIKEKLEAFFKIENHRGLVGNYQKDCKLVEKDNQLAEMDNQLVENILENIEDNRFDRLFNNLSKTSLSFSDIENRLEKQLKKDFVYKINGYLLNNQEVQNKLEERLTKTSDRKFLLKLLDSLEASTINTEVQKTRLRSVLKIIDSDINNKQAVGKTKEQQIGLKTPR